jgi:hypothetical protein
MLVGHEENHPLETDVWSRSLFVLPRLQMEKKSGPPKYTIAQALETLAVTGCSWVNSQGRRLVEIRLREKVADPDGTQTYTIHFDPSANWLVRHIEFKTDYAKALNWKCTFDVEGFVEVAPSIFFPSAMRAVYKLESAESLLHLAKFTNVVVNQKPKLPFTKDLPIPRQGVLVTDRIEGITYQVDASGNRVGPTSLLREAPPSAQVPTDPLAPPKSGTWKWLALIGAVCLGLWAMAFYMRRRYRGGIA